MKQAVKGCPVAVQWDLSISPTVRDKPWQPSLRQLRKGPAVLLCCAFTAQWSLCVLSSLSLAKVYGSLVLPRQQGSLLSLPGVIQRNTETNTYGISVAAGVARAMLQCIELSYGVCVLSLKGFPVWRAPTRLQGYYLTRRWVTGGGMLGISICQPQRCGLYHRGLLLLRDPLQFNLGPHGTKSSCVAMRGGLYRQKTCTPQFLVSAPVKRPSQAVTESRK